MIKRIPNLLTTVRLLLVPVFIVMFFRDHITSAAIFVIACLTDIVDGYIARHFDAQSKFGAVFDPLADKLMANFRHRLFIYCGLVSRLGVGDSGVQRMFVDFGRGKFAAPRRGGACQQIWQSVHCGIKPVCHFQHFIGRYFAALHKFDCICRHHSNVVGTG